MQGKCFIFSDQGGGSDFVFYADTNKGYESTYSIENCFLEIFHPVDGDLVWAGKIKGKNLKAMAKLNYLGVVPEDFPARRVMEWYEWFVRGYPAVLTGAKKSWAQT